MTFVSSASKVIVLVAFLALLNGCAYYTLRPVDLQVTSSDSNGPVAGISIRATYLGFAINAPKNVEAFTDERGHAIVDLADYEPQLIQVGGHRVAEFQQFIITKEMVRGGGTGKRLEGELNVDLRLSPVKKDGK